jgi:hypothetical protein
MLQNDNKTLCDSLAATQWRRRSRLTPGNPEKACHAAAAWQA